MAIAASTRQKLTTISGQSSGHCATNVGSAMTGPGSAGESTAAASSAHASSSTASAPT